MKSMVLISKFVVTAARRHESKTPL